MKLAPNRWAIVWLLCQASCALAGGPTATLQVIGDPVQPEGLPILLTLTIRNTGPEPIYFWRGGAGDYPDASHFAAAATHQGNHRTWPWERLSNSNGQLAEAAGRLREIRPGQSVSFPAALRPFPAGSYRVVVAGEPQGRSADGHLIDVWFPAMVSDSSLRIDVLADGTLAQKREEQIIAKVRAGDPFAEHVAGRYSREAVWDALEKSLSGDDIVAAEGAIEAFWPDRNPPTEAAPTIAKAVRSHLKPINEGHDEWMMHQLLHMARQLDTPEVGDAVSQLSAARADGRVRDYARGALAELHPNAAPSQRVRPLGNSALDRDDSARQAAAKELRNLNADRVWRKLDSVLPTTQP